MKRLFLSLLLLASAAANAQFTPGQILTAQELNNQFALYVPLSGATMYGPLTVPTLTVTGAETIANVAITGGTINGVSVGAITPGTGAFTTFSASSTSSFTGSVSLGNSATATEQGFTDNSNFVATDNFTKRSILAASATLPISLTSGTYNFATAGTGASFATLTSSGSISSILAIAAGGSGYQVGDCVVMVGGNGDAIVQVTSVSSGAVTAASVLYGGTGYSGSPQLSGQALPPGSRTGALTGTLTGNATIIIPAGTYLQGGRRLGFQNNTTGAFTVTVKLSNGSGGSTGTGVVLPQGSGNATSVILYTDGQNDVWSEVGALVGTPTAPTASTGTSTGQIATTQFVANTFASPPAIGSTTPAAGTFTTVSGALNGSVGATTPSTGSFTTLAASSTISGTGFTNYFASPPAIGGTAANTGAFTNLSSSGTISGTGFSSYLASPPSIGSTTAGSGAFTTLSASSTVSGAGFSTYLSSPPAIGSTAANTGRFSSLTVTTGGASVTGGMVVASGGESVSGGLTMSSGGITPITTTGITGTTAGDNAIAGSWGEYSTASNSSVSMSTNTPANCTSQSFAAGDWDIQGIIQFTPNASTTVSQIVTSISATSATLGGYQNNTVLGLTFTAGASQTISTPVVRENFTAATTVYLVGQSSFGTSTMTCNGTLRWRRIR